MKRKIAGSVLALSVVLLASSRSHADQLSEAYGTMHQTTAEYAQAQAAKDESCRFCWSSNFTPLTGKAKAVWAWEQKRVELSAATPIAGFAVLGALLSHGQAGGETMREYSRISSETEALRAKAIAAGGLELKDGAVRLKLVKGVDYTLDPALKPKS